MDKLSVHQKGPKPAKARKKKQIKVVYISNPMRFTATASEFKGLVQQFTGQYSDVGELSKFADAERCDEASAAAEGVSFSTDDDSAAPSRPDASTGPQQQLQQCELYRCVGAPFEAFDEVFTPQVLENLAAFMPSSLCYEPPPPPVM